MPYFYNTILIIGVKLIRAVVVLGIVVYGTILFRLLSAVRPF